MKNPADSRMIVLRWLIQEDGLMEWFKGVEVGMGDAKWRDFVPTVLMHGDRDEVAPYQGSVKVRDVVGESLFSLDLCGGGKWGKRTGFRWIEWSKNADLKQVQFLQSFVLRRGSRIRLISFCIWGSRGWR